MSAPVILVVGSGRAALEASMEVVAQGGRAILVRSPGAMRQCSLRTSAGFEVIEAELAAVDGCAGRFRARLRAGDEVVVECSAIVLAPGPEDRPRIEGAMTLDDLERGAPDGVSAVAVVLRPGASRGSFVRAVRAALELRPRCAVTVFASEMGAFGTDELEYRRAQAEGVVFVRSADAEIGATVRAADPVTGTIIEVRPDLLVIESAVPEQGDLVKASNFRTLRGCPGLGANSTAAEGIVYAGREDDLLDREATTAGRAAATRALTIARSPPDRAPQAAVVDIERCSACLTCARVCPHGAARPGEEGKAVIDGDRCQACGICVGACPGRALSLPSRGDAVSGEVIHLEGPL